MNTFHQSPRSAIVIGAGIVGLSTAWHLQRHGISVTVIEKSGPAAGASWGNAGWVSPGLVMPLAEPGAWKHAARGLFDRNAPLRIPARLDPQLWKFLLQFASNMTAKRWEKTVHALQPITSMVTESFAEMASQGITSPLIAAPLMAGFSTSGAATAFRTEIEKLREMGQSIDVQTAVAGGARDILSSAVPHRLELSGQSYLDPGDFTCELARSVKEDGGRVLENTAISHLAENPYSVTAVTEFGDSLSADTVVIATGAWMSRLAAPWGLKLGVRAGRGYSFTVTGNNLPAGPLYFPEQRVVCTPYQGALRVAGTMEFRGPDEPMKTSRVDSISHQVAPLLTGIDWGSRRGAWVGSRPVTPDGLPVVGALKSPRIFAAGGHGMWGVVLGPATGKLLAQQIITGVIPDAIAAFDPLRK
ncbi:FAD-dependent oxidoreductase [Specibacter sp. NPDC078692]|uniref:NAD(P)/FAD-dependent oxidoreductase n=1 Tax=Specibacter sp. NPDC078692 TaxID=3155818 RepID=UPI0034229F99